MNSLVAIAFIKTEGSPSPLYSVPVIPQVHPLAVTDVPRVTASADHPALQARMTQEQFNTFMSS